MSVFCMVTDCTSVDCYILRVLQNHLVSSPTSIKMNQLLFSPSFFGPTMFQFSLSTSRHLLLSKVVLRQASLIVCDGELLVQNSEEHSVAVFCHIFGHQGFVWWYMIGRLQFTSYDPPEAKVLLPVRVTSTLGEHFRHSLKR